MDDYPFSAAKQPELKNESGENETARQAGAPGAPGVPGNAPASPQNAGSRPPYPPTGSDARSVPYSNGAQNGGNTPYGNGSQNGGNAPYRSNTPYGNGSQNGNNTPYGNGSPYTSGAPYGNAPGGRMPYGTSPYSAPYGTSPYGSAPYGSAPHSSGAGGTSPAYQTSPSEIYRTKQSTASPYGGAPQYHYGAPMPMLDPHYYQLQQEKMQRRRTQQREIHKVATVIACAMLFTVPAGIVIVSLLQAFGLLKLNETSFLFQSGLEIYYSVIAIGTPFLIASLLLKKSRLFAPIPFHRPNSPLKALLTVLFGFAGCLAANYLVSVFSAVCESFGFSFDYSSTQEPSNLPEVLLMFVFTAVIPPLVEEFAMRGVVLQSLRRYGNGFAIGMTAFCFGILHGNPAQIPFAFLCALFISYAVIATDSIWTGVIIHAMVNSLSCIYSTLLLYTNEKTAEAALLAVEIVFFIIGILAGILYYARYRTPSVFTWRGDGDFTTKERVKRFICNPAMLIAVIVFVLEALSAVTTHSGTFS